MIHVEKGYATRIEVLLIAERLLQPIVKREYTL